MHSRQSARPYPQPARLVVGVGLDLACKGAAGLALGLVGVLASRSRSLTDWSGSDPRLGWALLGAVGAYVFFAIWRHYHGRRTICSLCRGSVFHVQHSVKHREATKWPGFGYRTSVVLSLFFTGRYNCMYCGTPFRLKK